MPVAQIAKGFYTAQNAVGVALGGNVAERERVGGKEARRNEFGRGGENDIAGAA